MDDADFWKKLALYLADCQATTCEHDGNLAACSKSARDRYKRVCAIAAEAIQKKTLISPGYNIDETYIIARLKYVSGV